MSHPRDRFITVYGRKPVLEALADDNLLIEKVVLEHKARGGLIQRILKAAKRRDIPIERANPKYINRLSRNARQDQGVVADVIAPRMASIQDGLPEGPANLFLLDGVTNPANVGLILRAVTAAGAWVVLPRIGCPSIGPLVIKASAGVAFRAPILKAETTQSALEHLRTAGYTVLGLRGGDAPSIYDAPKPERAVYLLGNESVGVTATVDEWRQIPMVAGVESLNVATAAAVVAFELARKSG